MEKEVLDNENPRYTQPLGLKHISPIMLAVVLLLLIFTGAIFYYLGSRTVQQGNQTPVTTNEQTNNISTSPTQDSPTSTPSTWETQISDTCNVVFPIPPADNQQVSWQFEEYQSGFSIFNNTARVIYKRNDELGSGQINAMVEVMCSNNSNNYTTSSLRERLISEYPETSEISRGSSAGTIEDISVVKRYPNDILSTQWGRSVATINFQGGMFDPNQIYILTTTDSNIYLIRKVVYFSHLEDEATNIFENLEFIE